MHMAWTEQVFRYCERAQDPAFWAEPFNAASNAGFLIVAGVAARRAWRGGAPLPVPMPVWALIVLTALIGAGSFLFHTFATKWSRIADVVPIGVFMAVYLVLALRSFLGLSWTRVALSLLAFLAATEATAAVTCPQRLVGVTEYVREPCLNGTMAYLPALAALLLTGALIRRKHPAARYLLLAGGTFFAAMLMRWIDVKSCAWTVVLGHARGTHALWHLLNAVTLHLLLTASLLHATGRSSTASAVQRRA